MATAKGAYPALLASALTLAVQGAYAQQLPTGGQVAAGAAVISNPSAQSLRVDQASQNAILNWQSFSIGSGNSVVFQQPSSSAIALNRVLGNSASEIFGSLSANGQGGLIDLSGVVEVIVAPGYSFAVAAQGAG